MDTLMTIEQIAEGLQKLRLSEVEQATGISFTTLSNLRKAKNENYTIGTLRKVSDYIYKQGN